MCPALALVLAAAPTAADAAALAHNKQWDELYLAWAAMKPDDFAPADRARIAQALGQGCAALLQSDAVMAQSLGEKAVAFGSEADATLCAAKAAAKTEQRGAAEALLRTGRKQFATDDRFALELGRLLLSENDSAGARKELTAISPKSKQHKEAQGLIQRAKALDAQAGTARAEVRALERQQEKKQLGASGEPPAGASLTYESGVDDEGRRTRGNTYFRFRYFNGQRDFGERAEYEGRVQAALEEARSAANRLLGVAREKATDVVLYSRSEFTLHHGPQAAQAIAGFYAQSAIRMNDSAEINAKNQATLVHEYVHAVLDEAAHFHDERVPVWMNEGLAMWVEWRYQGFDGPPPAMAAELRGEALKGALPSLKGMARSALVGMDNPHLRYSLSGGAVTLLLQDGGPANLLGLFSDVGGGAPFDGTFAKRYGRSLAEFEEKLAEELKSR